MKRVVVVLLLLPIILTAIFASESSFTSSLKGHDYSSMWSSDAEKEHSHLFIYSNKAKSDVSLNYQFHQKVCMWCGDKSSKLIGERIIVNREL